MIHIAFAALVATASTAPATSPGAPGMHLRAQADLGSGVVVAASPVGILIGRNGEALRPSPATPPSVANPAVSAPIEAVLALGPSSALAVDDFGRVFRSEDGGMTWPLSSNGLPVPFWHRTEPVLLARDPARADSIYALLRVPIDSSRNDAYLFRSADGGKTWALLKELPHNTTYTALAVRQQEDHPVVEIASGLGTATIHDDTRLDLAPSDFWVRPVIEPERLLTSNPPATPDEDRGNVAVLYDDGTFVSVNDIQQRMIRFSPLSGGLQYKVTWAQARAVVSLGTNLGLTDEGNAKRTLPFSFPFFGSLFTDVFISANGNLTLGVIDPQADTKETDARFTAGPARIAVLWDDLDPTIAPGRVDYDATSVANQVTITWSRVTEICPFSPPCVAGQNSFQVTLALDGSITMTWGAINLKDGLIGITPGSSSAVAYADFTLDAPFVTPINTGIFEWFQQEFFNQRVARRFYHCHPDAFDQLIVFGATNYPYFVATEGLNATTVVANFIPGLGMKFEGPDFADSFDHTAAYGSVGGRPVPATGRLSAFVNMGLLADYPADPTTKVGNPWPNAEANGLDILGEAVGRRWGSYIRTNDPTDPSELLGRNFTHWSFFHDAGLSNFASDMEGNKYVEPAPNAFQTAAADDGYSLIDQYLMGLVLEPAVPTVSLIVPAGPPAPQPVCNAGPCAPYSPPEIGIAMTGTRKTINVQTNVWPANGARTIVGGPGDEPTTATPLRQAWILVVPPGSSVVNADVLKMEGYRVPWQTYFTTGTDGRGSVDGTLAALARVPVGRVGNNLLQFKSGDNIIFDWSKGKTVPASYIMFGSSDKNKLDEFDTSANGLRNQTTIKTFDLERTEDFRAVVTRTCTPVSACSYFFEVYGRTCTDAIVTP